MDKIKINNQIVCLRKFVKQAKVHILNKLVKDVKQYQNKKGNDTQLEKYKRKAERLLSEIEIIKKILPDTVSKMVLTKEKDWKNILINKDTTLRDRSLAMVANYEPLQKEVAKFHESNPNLVNKLSRLIREWEKRKIEGRSKRPQKKIKAFEIKQNKKSHREKSLNSDRPDQTLSHRSKNFSPENNAKYSPSEEDTEEIPNLTNDFVETSDKVDTESLISESESNESDSELNVLRNVQHDDSFTTASTTNSTTSAHTLRSEKNQKSIKTLNLEELMDFDEIPIEDEGIAEDSETLSTELKDDPFFLGKNSVSCDSDEKKSHKKTDIKNNIQNLHKLFRREEKFAKFGNRKERRGQKQFPGRNINSNSSGMLSNFKDNGNQKQFGQGKSDFRKNLPSQSSTFEKNFNKSNFSKQDKFDKSKFDDKPLHPSWEAKRKLKQSQMDVSSAKAKRFVF